MKKYFLLQILYVILVVVLLAMVWEFVLEDFVFADAHEESTEKVKYILTSVIFVLIALAFPVYKGLTLINSWKELEKIFITQGLQVGGEDKQEINSLNSIKSILMDELNRRKKAEDGINSEREKFFNMLDQLPVCFHLQAADYTIPFANKMFRERFGPPERGLCYQVMHNRSKSCDPCPTFKVFDSRTTESSIWTSPGGKTYLTVVTPYEDREGSRLLMEMAVDITSEQKAKDDLKRVLEEQEGRIKERTLELERSNNSLKVTSKNDDVRGNLIFLSF